MTGLTTEPPTSGAYMLAARLGDESLSATWRRPASKRADREVWIGGEVRYTSDVRMVVPWDPRAPWPGQIVGMRP
jgi:hypothetical protein